jgi:hypothetical protein
MLISITHNDGDDYTSNDGDCDDAIDNDDNLVYSCLQFKQNVPTAAGFDTLTILKWDRHTLYCKLVFDYKVVLLKYNHSYTEICMRFEADGMPHALPRPFLRYSIATLILCE